MATTIHVPASLLDRVDARAKALGVSRNRVILDAIEGALGRDEGWPPELLRMLAEPLDSRSIESLDDTMTQARARRSPMRRPPDL